ncbi:MAG: hypothetical protein ABFD90_19710 [Phycisphaerales bacterium]
MHLLARILNRHTEIEGELGYFGLGSWWLATFSARERQAMETAVRGAELPAGARPLTRDRGLLAVQTAAELLVFLADRLSDRPEDRSLACLVLAKAEERALVENDLLGLHSTYHLMIRLHLRWRDHFIDAADLAFAACHRQIRISSQVAQAFRERFPGRPLPIHLGYQHAASLLEQQDVCGRAIEICKQALEEGWSGNWSLRIGRMARQLHDRPPTVRYISSSGMGPV